MIKKTEYNPSKVVERYNPEIGKLIQSMLNKDPAKRPTIDELMKNDLIVNNLWIGFKYLLKCKLISLILRQK